MFGRPLMNAQATVFVVLDDAAVRNSVRRLAESAGFNVETFGTTGAFLEAYDPARPGCLVLDVRLLGIGGLDLLERLPACGITLPIIMVSGYGDVPTAVRAMKNGAADFMQKPFDEQDLLKSIQRFIERDRQGCRKRAKRADLARRTARLTPREREVMDLVVAGKANKQIAVELGCSHKTVEVHRSRVMEKMGAGSVAELVRMALLDNGLAQRKQRDDGETPLHHSSARIDP